MEKEKEKSKRIDRKPGTAEEMIEELRRRLEATEPPPPPVRVRALVPFKAKGKTLCIAGSIVAVHGLSDKIPGWMRVTLDGAECHLPSACAGDGAPTEEILDWQ